MRIAPEDSEINCSAWYAFRLVPSRATSVDLRLQYTQCRHRYFPKVSTDGVTWVEVEGEEDGDDYRLRLELEDRPLFVAAQPLLPVATTDLWLDQLAAQGSEIFEAGKSIDDRPIMGVEMGASDASCTLLLLGRQHPPETTGAMALFHFVNLLASDHSLAATFRERYRVLLFPMLNPDGVEAGHWRHNKGHIDLNRDWGPFTQPETRAVMTALEQRIDRSSLQLMLDFHSTRQDVFYTLPETVETDPPSFTRAWLLRLAQRYPQFVIREEARHEVGRPVSKAYFYDADGIPTVTFELGDRTNADTIRTVAQQSALAMIETLLERDGRRNTPDC